MGSINNKKSLSSYAAITNVDAWTTDVRNNDERNVDARNDYGSFDARKDIVGNVDWEC